VREPVDDCRLLRHEHLVPRRQLEDRRREPDPLRHPCHAGERDVQAVDAASPRVVSALEDALDAIEPMLARIEDALDDLG
jgi:hypothetical protein